MTRVSGHPRQGSSPEVPGEPAPPPVLVTMGAHLGTLAAARSLARAGAPVTLADAGRWVPTRWSLATARSVPCPDVETAPRLFLEWLLSTGAEQKGRVLYPASDEMAWLVSRHRELLSRDHLLYSPPFAAVDALLNKWRLYQRCLELGVDAPQTWLVRGEEDVARVREAAGPDAPLMVKPQTQAFLRPHQKGRLVAEPGALAPAVRDFIQSTRYEHTMLEADPEVAAPMVQAYAPGAERGIYNLSGFVDETGALYVVEASRKVLQWPRRLGVGICFEEADVLPHLADGVARLCRRVGYHGVFEVEFVESGGRHLLIDFNPRFYGQMAFDVARGLDLPLLVYLAACGEREALGRAVREARTRTRQAAHRAYCNQIELAIVLRLLRFAGQLQPGDVRRWRDWLSSHRDQLTDAVWEQGDWWPAALVATTSVLGRVRHARSAWRAARGE